MGKHAPQLWCGFERSVKLVSVLSKFTKNRSTQTPRLWGQPGHKKQLSAQLCVSVGAYHQLSNTNHLYTACHTT